MHRGCMFTKLVPWRFFQWFLHPLIGLCGEFVWGPQRQFSVDGGPPQADEEGPKVSGLGVFRAEANGAGWYSRSRGSPWWCQPLLHREERAQHPGTAQAAQVQQVSGTPHPARGAQVRVSDPWWSSIKPGTCCLPSIAIQSVDVFCKTFGS